MIILPLSIFFLDTSPEVDNGLAIGLGVGISIFFVIIGVGIVIVISVWAYKKGCC